MKPSSSFNRGFRLRELLSLLAHREGYGPILFHAITGGPESGKSTTTAPYILPKLNMEGYLAVSVSEAATDRLANNISYVNLGRAGFQLSVLGSHLDDEIRACQAIRMLQKKYPKVRHKPAIVATDRGLFDIEAYFAKRVSWLITKTLFRMEGIPWEWAENHYAGVTHMDTIAKGLPELFGKKYTNAHRSESILEAVAQDDRTIGSWSWHPRFCRVKNTDAAGKVISADEKREIVLRDVLATLRRAELAMAA
ncbi:MAG TPA: hypothetical protein VGE35_01765 [Candidatus Paceibacterota bacterium]